jgi:hypothetical protein
MNKDSRECACSERPLLGIASCYSRQVKFYLFVKK